MSLRCPSVPFTTSPPHRLSRVSFPPRGRRPSSFPWSADPVGPPPTKYPPPWRTGKCPKWDVSHLLPGKLLFFPFSSPGGDNVFTQRSRNQGNRLGHSFPDPSHPTSPQVLSTPLLLFHSVSLAARICICICICIGSRPASLTLAVTLSIHPAIRAPSRLWRSATLMML